MNIITKEGLDFGEMKLCAILENVGQRVCCSDQTSGCPMALSLVSRLDAVNLPIQDLKSCLSSPLQHVTLHVMKEDNCLL